MGQRLSLFLEVPLGVTRETAVVIQHTDELRLEVAPLLGHHRAGALVKIQVPQPMHMLDLKEAFLSCNMLFFGTPLPTALALLQQPA